jgi:hypothetical protein
MIISPPPRCKGHIARHDHLRGIKVTGVLVMTTSEVYVSSVLVMTSSEV